MLTEINRVRYWETREEAFHGGLPVGFIRTVSHILHVVFYNGYLLSINQQTNSRTIRGLEFRDFRARFGPPRAVQKTPQGLLAVLYLESEGEFSERCRPHIALHSEDGRLVRSVQLTSQARRPMSTTFAVTRDTQFIFPYISEVSGEREGRSESEQPLLTFYDNNGNSIRSFGPPKRARPVDGPDYFLLVSHENGDCLIFFRLSYRFLRFSMSGDCIIDRTIEMPFHLPPPIGTHFSLIKDVAVGTTHIAVLLAKDAQELYSRVGTRIDLIDGDGNYNQTYHLDYPAAFIQIDADGNLWCLHEPSPTCLIGDVPESPHLIAYAMTKGKKVDRKEEKGRKS